MSKVKRSNGAVTDRRPATQLTVLAGITYSQPNPRRNHWNEQRKMTKFKEDDLDQIESEISLRECCQSGCTACILDYQPTGEPGADPQLQNASSDLLEAIRLACALADKIEPGVRED